MAIEIPKRKNVKARAIAEQNPHITPAEVAKLADLDRGASAKALGPKRVVHYKLNSKASRRRDAG